MPWIDLSFVTLDPSIAAIPFRVYRRRESVNALGRSIVEEQIFNAVGGVFPTGSNTLKRDPERDFSERGITIISRFRLQLTSIGYKPDLVEWPLDSGNLWIVNFVNDYSQYGWGFIEAQLVFFDPEHPTGESAA